MKIKPFNSATLLEAVKILKQGGVIAHPADTCFGLAGDLMNPIALSTIQEIKGRDAEKPMSIMFPIAAKSELKSYVELNDFSKQVCDKLLPGPVTLLLPKGSAIPANFYPKTQLVGIRIPDHDIAQQLLQAFDGPLITTSANISGESDLFSYVDLIEKFENLKIKPDLIFEGSCDTHTLASTVILVGDDHLKILRDGPVTANELQEMGFDIES